MNDPIAAGHAFFQLPAPIGELPALDSRPTIVISASIPKPLNPAEHPKEDWDLVAEINENYANTIFPERIRAAVAALARVVLHPSRNMRLVFGAHPTISPMILQTARDINSRADCILIFQSDAYRSVIPESTLALANWSKGRLILTRADPSEIAPPAAAWPTLSSPAATSQSLRRVNPYPKSLRLMREMMMSVPGVLGAVFIGGMKGVEDEAALFAQLHPGGKRYALPTTGSAAKRLDDQHSLGLEGTLLPHALRDLRSYTVAASMIVDDLLPSGGG